MYYNDLYTYVVKYACTYTLLVKEVKAVQYTYHEYVVMYSCIHGCTYSTASLSENTIHLAFCVVMNFIGMSVS